MSESSLVNNFFGFSIFKLCKNVYLPTFPQKCLPLYISLKIGLVYVELIRFRKNSDFIDIGNFEVGIRPYSFATAVFMKLGSMLSGTSRHCSVLVAPDVSGHDHFGTYSVVTSEYIETSTIRDCITARKVGPNANSALISYPSLRL